MYSSPSEDTTQTMSLNKTVFIGSAVISILLIIWTIVFPTYSGALLGAGMAWVSESFGWYYMLVVAAYSIFALFVGFSKYGDIKLGQDHEKAQFPFLAWAAMLFSAGIGIDLLFFGASEPLMHYLTPHAGLAPASEEAMRQAVAQTFLHWGLHGWGIYALIGMALAYFAYRKNMPLALRSPLTPIFGERLIKGWLGDGIDTFGVVCTLMGIATSLGIGVLQANAGLTHVFGIESSKMVQTIIIVCVVVAAAISAMTGVERGVRRLSEFNMLAAILFLVAILVMGNTVYLLNTFTQSVGQYFQTIVAKTFDVYAYDGAAGAEWKSGWTVFFWAWWVAWAPFVGLFIARISRGRTLREFVFGVMFIPLGFIFAWFSIFGNSAIELVANGATELGEVAVNDAAMGLFALFEYYPYSDVLSLVGVIIGLVFFITSADSGALVLANLSSRGLINGVDAPVWLRLFWAAATGLITLGLLFAGGFSSLQSVSVIAGLPFSVILVLYMIAMWKSLKEEGNKRKASTIGTANVLDNGKSWKARLQRIVSFPKHAQVEHFLQTIVLPAMTDVESELRAGGLKTALVVRNPEHIGQDIDQGKDQESVQIEGLKLQVGHGDQDDFIYEVNLVKAERPNFTLNTSSKLAEYYYRAEVFLSDGSQEYDLVGYSKEQVLVDILNQYERHMQYLHLER
ncbi:choline/carnitine/betaine transporter, BCCT family [Psychrobacter arcticus 273-4]|uniref:Choline/carnitine/betaine transporter, BCCT family n=1 Tax=Psychrobacter arcticus (strain DSM 17307 / VKM B-2377 / 273-4) TaxID=259536 RepID=Q4FTS7_PSYA2|nr:choline BCCT transporter BetT [Psychrobacter arcticus]AAZ18581.1 choline/carnitine/betaine transporter, BCCT family [Psychrobacter arcticus 273-4]